MAVLGKRIKEVRGILTQKEFAERLGLDHTTIASWESGRREPDLESLIKMADMGGVSLDWLVGRSSCATAHFEAINNPQWREIIEIAIDNEIQPGQLRPIITAITAIKRGINL